MRTRSDMSTNTVSRPTIDVRPLRERVHILLDLSRFQQALVEVHRWPRWESDPEALQLIGLIVHRCAPRSKHRSSMYSFARAMYRTAAAATRDASMRAKVLDGIGASYFEQGRLHDAIGAFEASRSLAPDHPRAHLGLLALACATRDLAEIRRRCKELVEDVPRWHANREAVASLATDPDFSFLRARPELFLECLGGYPDHLRALHDQYCMEALERGLTPTSADSAAECSCHTSDAGDLQGNRRAKTRREILRIVRERAWKRRSSLAPRAAMRRIDTIRERSEKLTRSAAWRSKRRPPRS